MSWALAAAVLALLGLLASGWYGSHICSHPPKMLPNEVWPEQFGLVYEKVEFATADGIELKGWFIPAKAPTDRTVMFLHGWGDNKGDLLRRIPFLAERFNLFGFDFRHHGQSGGERSSIGCLETRDAQAALAFLRRARPAWAAHLGVLGLSMGAGVAAWIAAKDAGIRAVVMEAPFPSFNRVVGQWTHNSFRLPYFPFAWLCILAIRWRLGEDHEPSSSLYHVGRIAPRPVFVVAGEEDRLMPLAAVREVFAAAGEPKELWVVPGAGHGKCWEAAPEDYPRRLTEFFERHL